MSHSLESLKRYADSHRGDGELSRIEGDTLVVPYEWVHAASGTSGVAYERVRSLSELRAHLGY